MAEEVRGSEWVDSFTATQDRVAALEAENKTLRESFPNLEAIAAIVDKHAQREAALQEAVDRAHGALVGSAYVGGPSEREAWRIALDALGAVVTQHTGVPDA